MTLCFLRLFEACLSFRFILLVLKAVSPTCY